MTLATAAGGCDVFDSDGPGAAELQVLDGGQEGLIRAPLDLSPGVRVLDGQGRPIAGVQVSFEIAKGAGELMGGRPTTDEAGEARVVSWRMGRNPGTNVLTAVVDGVAPVEVTAEARDPCGLVRSIAVGESVVGRISPYHCRNEDGRPMEMFDLVVEEPSRFLLDMRSDSFAPLSGILAASGFPVATNFQGHEGFARVALVPGTYRVEARALSPGTNGGPYNLDLQVPAAFSEGCGPEYYWWVSHGMEMDGEITGEECLDDVEAALDGERRDGHVVLYHRTIPIRFAVSGSGSFLATIWSHGLFRGAWRSEAGEELVVDFTPPSDVPTWARVYVTALPGTTYRIRF